MEKKYQPLGVFDSGLGGLTMVKEILRCLPKEDVIFFGDTGRVPYGGRSQETIKEYVREDIDFLLKFNVKAVVIACNTADSAARKSMVPLYDIPIVGVVEPAAKKAAATSKNGRIGMIGTKATVRSGAYEAAVAAYAPKAQVFSAACPLLVPLVEEGRFHKEDPVVRAVLTDYLKPLQAQGIDTLILGCTHYPLLYHSIQAILPGVELICSGPASSQALIDTLAACDLLNDSPGPGAVRYFVSDSPESFAENGGRFIGRPIDERVELVSLL